MLPLIVNLFTNAACMSDSPGHKCRGKAEGAYRKERQETFKG